MDAKTLLDIMNGKTVYSTDYKGRCGNCHELLRDDAKYCQFCGTKKGEGEFKPYKNSISVVYGPPMNETYFCIKCNKAWINEYVNASPEYCPYCSSKVSCLVGRQIGDSPCSDLYDPDLLESIKLNNWKPLLSEAEINRVLGLRYNKEIDPLRVSAAYNKCKHFSNARSRDRAYLKLFIFFDVKGKNTLGLNSKSCPICKNNILARAVKSKEDVVNCLYYIDDYEIEFKYRCLACGAKFNDER